MTLHTRGEILVAKRGQNGPSEAYTGHVRHRGQGLARPNVAEDQPGKDPYSGRHDARDDDGVTI